MRLNDCVRDTNSKINDSELENDDSWYYSRTPSESNHVQNRKPTAYNHP